MTDTAHQKYGTSLCFSCKNGRADRCEWIRSGKRVFEESKIKTIPSYSKREETKSEIVTKCSRYEKRRRKREVTRVI